MLLLADIALPNAEIFVSPQTQNSDFNNAQESVIDQASTQVNKKESNLNNHPNNLGSSRSLSSSLERTNEGYVTRTGGENGTLIVKLRGTQAFEPTYYFNGLPLTGALNGSQNFFLIPSSFISKLDIYPDSAPFWLSSMGIGGDINATSCTRMNCFNPAINKDSTNLFKLTLREGAYSYHNFNINHSYTNKNSIENYFTLEGTRSKENYPVFNNGNSVIHANEGYYEPIQNNDFKRTSFANKFSKTNTQVGDFYLDTVFSKEEKGVPGDTGSTSNVRLKRELFLTTLRHELFFFDTDLNIHSQLGFLWNQSEQKNVLNTLSLQGYSSHVTTIQVKNWITRSHFLFDPQFIGVSSEILASTFKSNYAIAPVTDNTSLTSSSYRNEARFALFDSLLFPVAKTEKFSVNTEGWISISHSGQEASCGSSLNPSLCSKSISQNDKPLFGSTLSLQAKIQKIVPYARYSLTQRRPYLVELFGSPGGVLQNTSLKNEQSQKIETGLYFPFGDFIFYNGYDKNLIFMDQVSAQTAKYKNIGKTRRNGFILETNQTFFNCWDNSVKYQYFYAEGTLESKTNKLPRSPTHTLSVSTGINQMPLPNFFNYEVHFSSFALVHAQSKFYLDFANQNQMSVPPIFDALFALNLKNNSRAFTLSFDIYNITNEMFSTVTNDTGLTIPSNTNGYFGIPMPGRRFFISFSGEF